MMYESYEMGCADIVLLYICTHCVAEEGTCIVRAECEDGVIYIHISGGRDPYGTGGVRRRCYISYWEEGTCIARAEYEDGAMIHI